MIRSKHRAGSHSNICYIELGFPLCCVLYLGKLPFQGLPVLGFVKCHALSPAMPAFFLEVGTLPVGRLMDLPRVQAFSVASFKPVR